MSEYTTLGGRVNCPQCSAITAKGKKCKSPAVKNNNVCRMHGGREILHQTEERTREVRRIYLEKTKDKRRAQGKAWVLNNKGMQRKNQLAHYARQKIKNAANRPVCKGTTLKGNPCTTLSIRGTDVCKVHGVNLRTEEERRRRRCLRGRERYYKNRDLFLQRGKAHYYKHIDRMIQKRKEDWEKNREIIINRDCYIASRICSRTDTKPKSIPKVLIDAKRIQMQIRRYLKANRI